MNLRARFQWLLNRRKLILDGAAAFNLLQTAWRIMAAPITLILVTQFLGADEQGYYYVFANVLALQVLLEAGVGFVFLRTVSTNARHIKIVSGNIIIEKSVEGTLGPYIAFAGHWFLGIATIVSLVTIPAGLLIFETRTASDVSWRLPWLLVAVCNCLPLAIQPFILLSEAVVSRSRTYRARFISALLGTLITWVLLAFNFGLYSLAASALVSFLVLMILIVIPLRKVHSLLYDRSRLNWRVFREFWSDQWRISLTWITGFLYWNSAPIIVFKLFGPAIAGHYGASLSMLNSLQQLSSSALNSRTAVLASRMGHGEVREARREFSVGLAFSLVIFSVALIALAAFVGGNFFPSLTDRLLPLPMILLLGGFYFFNILFAALALFARLRYNEPFLYFSLASNLLLPAGVFISAATTHILEISIISQVCIQLILLPWAVKIYASASR
ncbi:oligosaccharide flippase family protein [Solimonas flava]|uniref:oligosaccharide flippase family protein n=1 Tax=Solimonas flava TaxID=415849 RepID=UPI0012B54D17|nr:oligosaccharide flippase family protein [Solimonas flava]